MIEILAFNIENTASYVLINGLIHKNTFWLKDYRKHIDISTRQWQIQRYVSLVQQIRIKQR